MEAQLKKTIRHFNLPISEDKVVGYRQGMPMGNLKRKIAVINEAIRKFNLADRKEETTYIGDEEDDKTASEIIGIKYIKQNGTIKQRLFNIYFNI